ncbi:hypothetical protein HS125_04575 [bacterium]|nr:hypothetical protein [bacterium]
MEGAGIFLERRLRTAQRNRLPCGWYYGTLQGTRLVDARTVDGKAKAPYFGLVWRLTYYAPSRDKDQNPLWESDAAGNPRPLPVAVERTLRLFLSDKAEERSFQDLERLGFNGDFSRRRRAEERRRRESDLYYYGQAA